MSKARDERAALRAQTIQLLKDLVPHQATFAPIRRGGCAPWPSIWAGQAWPVMVAGGAPERAICARARYPGDSRGGGCRMQICALSAVEVMLCWGRGQGS